MRVTLSEYEGHPYVSLRLWERDPAGAWWPVRGKGCSVRLSEAGTLAGVLFGVASGRPALGAPPRPAPPGPRALPLPLDKGGRFDEFQ
jgi:hypothetical protein